MEKLESIVFLALCLGMPVLMAVFLLYRLVQTIRGRAGLSRHLSERGWQRSDEVTAIALLEGTGLDRDRARLSQVVEREDGVVAADYRWTSPGPAKRRVGRRRRLLIVPRLAPGPRGIVQSKVGALGAGLANALGASVEPIAGWEWATISADGPWLDADLSDAVRELLGSGERLHLGASHAVLSLPEGRLDELLDEAAARVEALRAALD